MQQVWLNLLSNSIKVTPNLGKITIELTQKENTIITFKDTGKGIPEKELATIFQRFYKLDKARNRKQAGNGLGLAIVKKNHFSPPRNDYYLKYCRNRHNDYHHFTQQNKPP